MMAVIFFIFSVAIAEEKLSVPTDPKASYFILEKSGSKTKPTLTTRRVGPSGESFAKRIFDCNAKTTKYLADSETREGLKSSKPEKEMHSIVEQSIAWYLYRHVCD